MHRLGSVDCLMCLQLNHVVISHKKTYACMTIIKIAARDSGSFTDVKIEEFPVQGHPSNN